MLKIKQFVFNNFEENTYIVYDTDTRDAIVVDPGMLRGAEKVALDNFVTLNNLKINQVVLTHGHLDHCFGAVYVTDRYGVTVSGNRLDEPLAKTLEQQAGRFGMGRAVQGGVAFDVDLRDGDHIDIGDGHLEVLAVPGHSPGGIALYAPAEKFVLVGDSLFRGSIGRTDLPGGDYATLIRAIRNKILTLPDDTVVLPGHGAFTTVATEKNNNPYL